MEYIPEKVWERIDRIIKKRYEGNTSAFAKALGFSSPRIFNRKYGKTIPITLIEAIKNHEKISSDFLLFGDTHPYSIPQDLLED
jgi:hypothetical protein